MERGEQVGFCIKICQIKILRRPEIPRKQICDIMERNLAQFENKLDFPGTWNPFSFFTFSSQPRGRLNLVPPWGLKILKIEFWRRSNCRIFILIQENTIKHPSQNFEVSKFCWQYSYIETYTHCAFERIYLYEQNLFLPHLLCASRSYRS